MKPVYEKFVLVNNRFSSYGAVRTLGRNTHRPNTTYANVVSARYMDFLKLSTISTGVKKIKELFKYSDRFNNL